MTFIKFLIKTFFFLSPIISVTFLWAAFFYALCRFHEGPTTLWWSWFETLSFSEHIYFALLVIIPVSIPVYIIEYIKSDKNNYPHLD